MRRKLKLSPVKHTRAPHEEYTSSKTEETEQQRVASFFFQSLILISSKRSRTQQASIPRERMRSPGVAREMQQPLRKVGRSRRRRTRRGRPGCTRRATEGIVRLGRSSRPSREQKAAASSEGGRSESFVRIAAADELYLICRKHGIYNLLLSSILNS